MNVHRGPASPTNSCARGALNNALTASESFVQFVERSHEELLNARVRRSLRPRTGLVGAARDPVLHATQKPFVRRPLTPD